MENNPRAKTIQRLSIGKLREYEKQFFFLTELIDIFTRRLNIRNWFFYHKINKMIEKESTLNNFSYDKRGLFDKRGRTRYAGYYEDNDKLKYTYELAPQFAALSRILAIIYQSSVRIVGKDKVQIIFSQCYKRLARKIPNPPDLLGYIPSETMGLSSSSSSSAFSISLTDNMIKYLVDSVIGKKGVSLVKVKSTIEELAKQKGIEGNYEKIIKQLIQTVTRLYGDAAVEKADLVKGLKVSSKGEIIKIDGNKKEILDKLSKVYTDMVGDLGRFIEEEELRKVLIREGIIK